MKRFGATDKQIQPMEDIQVFMVRLDLLIIIIQAALKGYPIGKYRTAAAIENANEIHKLLDRLDLSDFEVSSSSHLFKQRVKLLCIMATAIVSENYPLGKYRQQAVLDNLKAVVNTAFFKKQNDQDKIKAFHDILKVA